MSGPDAGIAWLAGRAQAQAALLDGLAEAAWLVDGHSLSVRHANAAAVAWLGRPLETLLGQPAEDLLPLLEDQAFWADAQAGLPGLLCSEVELPGPDGEPAPALRRVVALPGGDAGRPDWLVSLRDLRRERAAEQASDTLLAELRATLEATADGVLVTDLNGGVRAFNRRFAALWSLPESALAERDDAALHAWLAVSAAEPQQWAQQFHDAAQELLSSRQWRVRLVDGRELECRSLPQWSGGRPIGRVHSFREAAQRRPVPMRREADADALDGWTGLPERAGFVQQLEQAVSQARRSGAPVSVLCIELDRQALYGLGAQPGVQACQLAEVAQALRAGLRGPHVLARLGSARFGLLLPQAGEAAAEVVARRWLALAESRGPGPQALAGLSPVIGLAAYPQAGLHADQLLLSAEAAQAQARMLGLRCHAHRRSGDGEDRRQQRLEQALRQGFAEDPQFRLHYQPRLDPSNGQVQAVEALVRWRDPGQGELLPAQFLPLVERAGLGGVLDDWVLENVLRQAVRWREQGLSWPVTVNVGATQLARPGLARRVAAVLAHVGWPAELLELDVTEKALQQEPEAALATVRALRDLGVRVVLDDFGSGDASLSLLRRLPFSAVKLDRSLMRGVPLQPAERAMAEGLIGLARSLGLPVLVEGVETEAQRDFVAAMGCEGWQGFLCTPALESARLSRRLAGAPALSSPLH